MTAFSFRNTIAQAKKLRHKKIIKLLPCQKKKKTQSRYIPVPVKTQGTGGLRLLGKDIAKVRKSMGRLDCRTEPISNFEDYEGINACNYSRRTNKEGYKLLDHGRQKVATDAFGHALFLSGKGASPNR